MPVSIPKSVPECVSSPCLFPYLCRALHFSHLMDLCWFPPFSCLKTMETTTTPFYQNNTTNASEPNGSDEYVQYVRKSLNIMSLIVYCLAFALGVLGNGVVIWVTGFKMKKTVNTVWFLNLAVADFLFTAFLPLGVTYTAMDFHWAFGNFMCKLNSTINSLNMFVSVYILVVISVDRCVSVVWPVWTQNHRSVRRASYVSLGVWVLSLILSIPAFIFRDTEQIDEINLCFTNFALSDDYETESVQQLRSFHHQAVIITRFILGFVVPFTVIVSCYAVIIHRLRRNRTLANQSSRPFKIIAAVITAFFLCWAPFHILALIDMVNHTTKHSSQTLFHVVAIGAPIATSLAFFNSCLNPLLYVFMGQDFKDKVRKSILNVLETAFQEEVSRPYTHTSSMVTSRSKELSVTDAEV
ncbi:chemokine-like receptor 1 isoform X1 [Toxotes jaculatrix]|uniref:chemokine-like receptor 1 isoform X1 n=2 Tax=Toxotes jaculatrix TaxID=941984 RepID=UPI001B3ADD57|nr:chemokine-like receptor 1 isoform X1 [Toxotes jaculatrix]